MEQILQHASWYLDGEQASRRVVAHHRRGGSIMVLLDGVADRTEAERLGGRAIFLAPEDMPTTAEGEYYWTELEGLEVQNVDGTRLGVVDHLIETGANDVLVVRSGKRETLVPYVSEVIRRVDLDAGLICVDWQEE